MFKVIEYMDGSDRNHFREWMKKLGNKERARVSARILRFELGNLGDSKPVGEGVFEARFHFGAGYRMYFAQEQGKIIVLLCGGDKSSQARDIKKAKEFWLDYKENRNA